MNKELICGNDAIGKGAILAGCKFYAGYPITPQNELTAYMAENLPKAGGVFIQAESELAAINMVFGASVAGERAMTSSSSPGISLKQEGISYLAACQLPAVIVNVQRGGPGLGNIAPAQSDYFQATKGGGHGDYHMIVLAPASAQECLELTYKAFDLADKYRTPVMVLADGLLGQMMEPIQSIVPAYAKAPSFAKASEGRSAGRHSPQSIVYEKPWALKGCKGRGPQLIKSLLLEEGALERLSEELLEKYDRIRKNDLLYEAQDIDGAEIVIVAFGTSARIANAAKKIARQKGLKAGLIRPVTLFPFPERALNNISKKTKAFLVVEMNTGQMLEDVKLAACGNCPVYFYGRAGGGIPTQEAILEKIEKILGDGKDI